MTFQSFEDVKTYREYRDQLMGNAKRSPMKRHLNGEARTHSTLVTPLT